jgi:PAP_fibrillin
MLMLQVPLQRDSFSRCQQNRAWKPPALQRCPEAKRRRTRAHAAQTDEVKECKDRLRTRLHGLNRGIFGVKAAVQEELMQEVELLESLNSKPKPLQDMSSVAGKWRV